MKITIPDFCLLLILGQSDAVDAAAIPFRQSGELLTIGVHHANPLGAMATLEAGLASAARQLAARRPVAVVAPGLGAHARASLATTAKSHYAKAIALVAGLETGPRDILAGQLANEGFSEIAFAPVPTVPEIVRVPLEVDRRGEAGPFDIVGDVHGCTDELEELLARLGYDVRFAGQGRTRTARTRAPAGRRLVLVGDLVDRGPRTTDALRIAMAMVEAGHALCLPGNHDVKFLRWLKGAKVRISHGLETTIDAFAREDEAFRSRIVAFLEGLPHHLWLDGGRLVVAHAGIREDMIGRSAGRVREFCLYGDTAGETDASGLPVRYHWALDYRGAPAIVYGHTPVVNADWVGNTLCIDTGCCFGGKLTALRWPEREIVAVPARQAYAARLRPFGHPPPRPRAARHAG